MASRNQRGICNQIHQRMARAITGPARVAMIPGLELISTTIASKTVSDAITKMLPGMMESTNCRSGAHNGTLGCGVENSRLPHWEHACAVRGLGCLRGQSLRS